MFSHPTRVNKLKYLYEERITLWKALSEKEAYFLAEKEALNYAENEEAEFIEATDAFFLFESKLNEGCEVWSLMRDSNETDESYIKRFILTSDERSHSV